MVGVLGFEPRTSSLSGTRSNQLSYTPLTSPKSCHPSLTAERRPRDVSPRSLARLNQGLGSFSGIPCGFAVLMPARLDDVCQNRLLPNCPARYFLIFRSRCDNGAPRHLGAARLPPAERRPRDVSPRSLARLNQGSGSFSGIPCGFAVLMPARMNDVCQNRLVPNCPARYFLIFRSRWTTDLPLVEPKGLEPSTSCLQSRCSSQLSYGPLKLY